MKKSIRKIAKFLGRNLSDEQVDVVRFYIVLKIEFFLNRTEFKIVTQAVTSVCWKYPLYYCF